MRRGRLQIALVLLLVSTLVGFMCGVLARELPRVGVHQGYAPEQPIAFSHRLHAGDLTVPCLYCHFAARKSRHAGIPPATVCMNCHAIVDKQTAEIEKLREFVQQDRPIEWIKVHNLPDFVYFNHSQHVIAGVPCQQCHGRVETMVRVKQQEPLTMGWCIQCHRAGWSPRRDESVVAVAAKHENKTPVASLDCGKCHY